MIEKVKNNIVKYQAKEILKKNTALESFKHVKSIDIAINDTSDSLAKIKKKVGEKVSLAIIKVWLVNLNDFLNIKNKMLTYQIDETAQIIFDEFYYLKMSDISLVFKRIRTGYYGSFYESIDGMKILDMFYKYAQERVDKYIDSDMNLNKRNENEPDLKAIAQKSK